LLLLLLRRFSPTAFGCASSPSTAVLRFRCCGFFCAAREQTVN
jgi:hypothetical protein